MASYACHVWVPQGQAAWQAMPVMYVCHRGKQHGKLCLSCMCATGASSIWQAMPVMYVCHRGKQHGKRCLSCMHGPVRQARSVPCCARRGAGASTRAHASSIPQWLGAGNAQHRPTGQGLPGTEPHTNIHTELPVASMGSEQHHRSRACPSMPRHNMPPPGLPHVAYTGSTACAAHTARMDAGLSCRCWLECVGT